MFYSYYSGSRPTAFRDHASYDRRPAAAARTYFRISVSRTCNVTLLLCYWNFEPPFMDVRVQLLIKYDRHNIIVINVERMEHKKKKKGKDTDVFGSTVDRS